MLSNESIQLLISLYRQTKVILIVKDYTTNCTNTSVWGYNFVVLWSN